MRSSVSKALIAAALAASLAAAAIARPAHAADGPTPGVRLRRFALMIGVNDGGAARAKLRYATSDARSMARVLENLGGVAPADMVFVDQPSRQATLAGFARVDALMRAGQQPDVRRELLVYYSGHSDEEGLLLGNDRVSYDELRAHIKQLPADLGVAILDSCASGAFTRRKGGVRRPPFLVDASADMRGHAFLTSSAANEVAQESDRIAASFFTYYLVSGLRGAADVNQDHRVTLQEAYQFASQETLARTERTTGGAQHAAYEFDLAGTGDMVVTDLRTTQASLVLTPELAGRITVRDAGGALVAELRKPAGNTIELGVEAGTYVISMETSPRSATVFEAQATLVSGQRAELARLAFHLGTPLEVAAARGDASADNSAAPGLVVAAPEPAPSNHAARFRATVIPRAGDERTDIHGLSVGIAGDRVARLDGLQLAFGWTQADVRMHGTQLALGATIAAGDSSGTQLTSGVAFADGSFRGLQLAGVATFLRGEGRGIQAAGAANLVDGSVTGVQVAGAANIARTMRGLQLAPLNVAENQHGIQLGVANAVTEGGGLRLGVVNVGHRTSGFQVGVVNIAEHDDGESLALLNIIGNGIHDVALYATDTMLTNLSIKLGGRHLFTALGAGYQPGDALATGGPDRFARGTARWGADVGLGWRFFLPTGRLESLDLEAHNTNVFTTWSVNGNAPMLNALRLQAAVRLAPHLSLLAGLSGNVTVAQHDTDLDFSVGGPQRVIHSGATTVRIYPGFVAGLQI